MLKFNATKRNVLLLAGVAAGAIGLSQQVKADQNFTSFAFLATDESVARTDPDRWGDILNVKGFGAVGNGSTDDTAAIQLALNAKQSTGRALYFPPAIYKVSCPAATTITNIVTHTVGSEEWCLCTVASTTGFSTNDMGYVRGVVGVPNANFSYGLDVISAGSPGTILLRNARFTGAYVSGGTLARPCLTLRQAGGTIFSDGAVIRTASTNCAILSLDGFQSGVIKDLTFDAGDSAGTIGLDYNWCQRSGDVLSSQTCLFAKCSFFGADYGLAIGMGQAMCSETTIFDCFASGKTGMIVANQNALSQTIIGGNISGCKDYGIYVSGGSAPLIQSVAFQAYPGAVLKANGYIVGTTLTIVSMITTRHPGNGFAAGDLLTNLTGSPDITSATTIVAQLTGTTGGVGTYSVSNSQTFASSGSPAEIGVAGLADIYMPQGQNDAIVIIGCRSESYNFAWLPYAQPYSLIGNSHFSGNADYFFLHGAGYFTLSGNESGCWINPSGGTLEIDSSNQFSLANYWRHTEGADPNNPAFVSITPQQIITDATTARSTLGPDNSCLVQFTSSSAITYTLEKTDGSFTRMRPGSYIDIQQYGTGTITFTAASGVTVHAPTASGTITTSRRYSTVRVRVDASNVWSVSQYGITP